MPTYKAPGIHVEEGGGRPPVIEGVPTGIPAFLGETEGGPLQPQTVSSFGEYRRFFGTTSAFMDDALKGFFDNGGDRAFVARIIGTGGADKAVTAQDLRGENSATAGRQGLAALEADEFRDVCLIAAPGLTGPSIVDALCDHCERHRFRFAVLDSPRGSADAAALDPRTHRASSYAALYHPWLAVAAPGPSGAKLVPPSGHMLGVYARVDRDRGVWKAPANEPVRGADDLEYRINDREQDVLNPRGVNVIRHFPGRGIRVWGARTLASDPEWKYVSVRRYFIFLERSLCRGTEWVVFEPNGEPLWTAVRGRIEQFLLTQWRAGALMGTKPEQAFYVRCDRSTMTQEDLNSGRLVVEIGVAPMRPAEFVVFRLFQWTADRDDD
jgi:phage tail sheath protein FI